MTTTYKYSAMSRVVGEQPTIPIKTHADGTEMPTLYTDILDGETFLNIPDGIIYFRNGNIITSTNLKLPFEEVIANSHTHITKTAILNFGSIPGTNMITQTITDSDIRTSSIVICKVEGATTDHNEIEHLLIPFTTSVSNIINKTSFTLSVFTDYRVTGTFNLKYTIL